MKTTEFLPEVCNLGHMLDIMEVWEVKMHSKSEILNLL
jgi:hypothetical protein